ncbi:LysR substrate-binding domain-containing protein, partial [Acinetobacter baumannii]
AWALEGHGIMLRSEGDAAPYLRSGRLKPVLADWGFPPADIYLVFPTRSHLPAKTRAFVDFVHERMAAHRREGLRYSGW